MGTRPDARHAGTGLEKDPAPAGRPPGHLSVTQRALAQAEGRKGMRPVLSPPVPGPVPLPGHTGHDPGEPRRLAHRPAPTARRLCCRRRLTFPAAEFSAEGKNVF